METTIIEEDWMYFKQNEDDKWSIKYFRCQSPFLFIYKNEQLKREGKPELVLIINEYLEIHKTNDRICFCSFVKIKKKMKAQQYWSVITREGWIIIGKLYHVDIDGNKIDRNSKKRKSIKNKSIHKSKKSRTISIGFSDELKENTNRSSSKYDVIATKEHDDIETIYKWDITNVKVTYSQNDQIIIEEHPKSHTKLKFSSKQYALLFNQSIIKCMNNLQEYRENMSSFHPDITGVAKPLFPLTIYDTKYNKKYYFISLNQIGIEKWYKLLSPKPIEPSIKPLINKLEMNDSSLVNLDEVDEIYDLISRDLHVNVIGSNTQNNYDAMQRIINLPMEKRLMIIHMNAISSSFQGVHYWISILNKPKDPKHVLTLFLKHLDAQAVKKAKFIEQFVENDGLVSLLSIQKQIKNDIMMSDGEQLFPELRILLAKVFEIIGSALSYNEIIKENKATDQEKYKSMISKNNMHNATKISNENKDPNDNIFDEEDDDDIDQDEMNRLYGSDSDISENKSNDNNIIISPISIKSPRSVIGNAIQIRYKSGAEVIFDSEQKEEVIEYLVSSIWGFHETEILIDDLSPGIGVTKCLINLCLLKPEYAAFITTVLLELTDLGKENDNWWLPLVRTIENALTIYNECTSEASLNIRQNMFIVQDKCRNYIFGLLTLVLTMIDSFEINDRIFERKLLDSILFDDLLYNLSNAITDKQLHALILLYKQSKQSDINEVTYSQMEITQEFFDYLRDKTIENGFHQYLSNILTNLAAFPDDNEDVWINVEQYVVQWRTQLVKLDREESITPELNGNQNENNIINVNLAENMNINNENINSDNMTDENKFFMANINNFLTQSLNNKIENLETEKNELNSQYQSQLKQTNELQELLKEYKDKISVLEHELKEKEQKLKENINNKNTKNAKNTSENSNGNTNKNNNENKEKNLTDEQSKRKEKEESEIREKKNKLKKYERKKNDDKKEEKKEEIKQDINSGNLPPLNEAEQKLVDGFKKQLKMRVPPGAVKHKIKYKEKKPHLLPYVFPETAPVQPALKKLPELNEADKKELEKYKKLLKMRMPEPSVKLKMKRAKHNHLIPYVFPETQSVQPTLKKLPELNEEDKKELEKYKKLLKMRLPEPSVKLKMKRAKHDHLIPYLFKDVPNNSVNIPKSERPSDVEEKPKIKPNVSMLPFHWNKIKEKVIKNTIWYDIYHKYGKFKENQIFELSKLDELFGKKEDPNKKSKKNSKKNKNKNKSSKQNIIPSEVMILDKKTRQKIEIFLNRVRMNWNMTRLKICDHIININDFGLTHDHIEKLINVSPNLKESQEFKRSIKQLNESDILGKAALFWRELLSVDEYIRDRLILWEFKLTFKQLISEEEIKINILNKCIYKIRNDNEFKRVLALALDIGNYVNGGKRQGQAYGFNILTLEKLDQFPRRRNKDGTPVPTMLEYIYLLLKDKYTNSLLWVENLDILNEAITIDLNVINSNVKKFKTKVDLLHERIQSADETGFSGKNFVHKMTPFYKDAIGHLETFEDSVENLNKELKQLAVWFDFEDDNLDFLKQINVFRKTFKSIGPRLDKRKKDAERKAKRDKKKQSKGRGKGKNKKRGVKGGVAIIGLERRESILRAVAKKPQLKLDTAGNLAPQWSKGSSASRSRGPSRGGLRNELWKFAASVENKVKVV